jgi:hypothetical protein
VIKRTSSRSKPQLIGHGSVKRDHCSIEGIGERQPLAMPGWQGAGNELRFNHVDTVPKEKLLSTQKKS